MTDVMSAFQSKFRINELLIAENDSWTWSVRPGQCTLGAGILAAKRHVEQFSAINETEGAALTEIVKEIEATLHSTFKYDKINYLMLMMVDPPVHFHVIPRYEQDQQFAGAVWSDEGWPGPPNLAADEIEASVLLSIRDALRAWLV